MADHKYSNYHEEQKTKENLYAVLFGYLYVEHDGHIYEFIQAEEDQKIGRDHRILLSEVNTGDPLYTSWYEILYSPAFFIMKERKPDMKMYFGEYAELEWLEPEDYYSGSWTYVCTAQGDDGESYDIVRDGMNLRYTNI